MLMKGWRGRPIASAAQTAALSRVLVEERLRIHAGDTEREATTGEVGVERADWVPMLVDHGHVVRSGCGRFYAKRAVTADGVLLWYVLRPGKRVGYHARGDCPNAAFAETEAALARRREARDHWPEIRAFARDLRWGRQAQRVTRAHVNAAGLCVHGIDHFSRVFGLSGLASVPGAVIAWLMVIEPQLGLILYQTLRADQGAAPVATPAGAFTAARDARLRP